MKKRAPAPKAVKRRKQTLPRGWTDERIRSRADGIPGVQENRLSKGHPMAKPVPLVGEKENGSAEAFPKRLHGLPFRQLTKPMVAKGFGNAVRGPSI